MNIATAFGLACVSIAMAVVLAHHYCLFGHNDTRERDAAGKPLFVCQRCGKERPILATEIVKGPKAKPDQVLGQPTGKAKAQRKPLAKVWSQR